MLGGYANKLGSIDLSTGSVEYNDSPEEWKLKYVGGRGMGVKYVFDNGPGVDPLSPENILCFMNGPLTGSEANMSGRMAVVTKSPLTGTVTDSHHGGWSAARLRWAGFDFQRKVQEAGLCLRHIRQSGTVGCIGTLGQGGA